MKLIKLIFLLSTLTTTPILINAQNSELIYKANKVAEKTWVIVENNEVNIYLVEGNDSALIIDTGLGLDDLKSFVKKLTNLPLFVINTHGHGDHVRSDHQFSRVYLSPEDTWLVNAEYSAGKRANLPADAYPKLIPVKEGRIFNLGGRKLKVISVPGHTQGSIVLLDIDNKILFAGDNSNQLVWLFLRESLPLETYLKSLEKLATHINEFAIIMPGHGTPLKNTFVNEQIFCVKSILDGTCSALPYTSQSISDRALICKFGSAEVTYDPGNLRVKR